MNQETINDLNHAIKTLERKNRWLTLIVLCLFAIGVVSFLVQTVFKTHSSDSPSQDKILRVRGIVVVDENGTERIWISAPVPEPLILGKRFPRGGRMSITAVAFSTNGARLVSSSLDHTIRVWAVE